MEAVLIALGAVGAFLLHAFFCPLHWGLGIAGVFCYTRFFRKKDTTPCCDSVDCHGERSISRRKP